MLTYIINNQSGGIDGYGNTFHVTLNGMSTRTIQHATVNAARLRLQYGATDEGVEHLLMHSRALTSTGNTRFFHLVNGHKQNSNIIATLKKRLTNRKQYDEFELSTTHPLTLNHPLHTMDLFFTDSRGKPVPLGEGEEVTTTEYVLNEAITGLYKNQEVFEMDLNGAATANFDGNLVYTFTETGEGVGTITGQVIDSTWEFDATNGELTVYWDFANQGTSQWYKMEVGSNKAELVAIDEWNDAYTPGDLIWTKNAGQWKNAQTETFVDNGDNTGTVDVVFLWTFSEATGHLTLVQGDFTTSFSLINGGSDKIRLLLKASNNPDYDGLAIDTQIYRENTSTGTDDPVETIVNTGPANGFSGEEILLHVELNCRHKST